MTDSGSTGSAEIPRWQQPSQREIEAACFAAGKPLIAFASELEPALLAVVRQVEEILHNAEGRIDTKDFHASNILRIDERTGGIFIKIFTCVNGLCHVPAEGPLAIGIANIRRMGWDNIGFDFERDRS